MALILPSTMAIDTLEIKADKDFLDDARSFFNAHWVNMQEFILTYISQCMNADDLLETELKELPKEEITKDMIEAREATKDLKKSDRVSFSDNNYAI